MTYIFHATRDRFIRKIRKEGLHCKNIKSFKNQTKDNYVYFSYERDNAIAYAINADNIPTNWRDDNIVVLVVDRYALEPAYVFSDPNRPDEDFCTATTLAYGLMVPPDKIGIMNFVDKRIDPLVSTRLCKKHYWHK